MTVLVVPEDFRKDQFILKPLLSRLLASLGKPRATVRICQDPLLGGVEEALKTERIAEIVDRYGGRVQVILLCIDRDGNPGRRRRLDQLEEKWCRSSCCASTATATPDGAGASISSKKSSARGSRRRGVGRDRDVGAGRGEASPEVGLGGRACRSARQGTVLRRAGEATRRRRRPRWRPEGAGRRSRPPNRRGPPEMPGALRRPGQASGVDRPRRLSAPGGSESVARRPDAVPRAIVNPARRLNPRRPASFTPPIHRIVCR